MPLLSIVPDWSSMHPIVTHFPIVLLLVAPLFIVIAAILPPPKGRPFMISAQILLGLGTASLFVAVPTGDAAARLIANEATAQRALQIHENLAIEARGIFVMLFILYVWLLIAPKLIRRDGRLFSTVLPVSFLLLYCAGLVVLVHAAHQGGTLVHESGVHAGAATGSPSSPAPGN